MPARKSSKPKIVDAPIVEGEEKAVKFGWCSTGQCKDCIVRFTGHRCSCECHGEGEDSGRRED